MKRLTFFAFCLALTTFVTGCDLMTYIWQHIIGHGYNQVDMATIQREEANMRASSINGSLLPQNTVVVYKTRHGYYGKLAMLAAPASNFNFQFTTYDPTDGSVKSSASSLTVGNGGNCDLETGDNNASPPATDFQWSGNVFYPQSAAQGSALFYILP